MRLAPSPAADNCTFAPVGACTAFPSPPLCPFHSAARIKTCLGSGQHADGLKSRSPTLRRLSTFGGFPDAFNLLDSRGDQRGPWTTCGQAASFYLRIIPPGPCPNLHISSIQRLNAPPPQATHNGHHSLLTTNLHISPVL